MADVQTNNTKPLIHNLNGKLEITDGSNNYILHLVEEGTLEVTPGGYVPFEYQDYGVNQVPVEGNEQPSTIKFNVKYCGVDTNDLAKFLQGRDTATGKVKTFTVKVTHYETKSQTSDAHLATFTGCYVDQQPVLRAGQTFDLLNISFKSTNPLPTLAVTPAA